MRGLARRVREERRRRGMTQQDLADAAGVAMRTIHNFERETSTPQAANLRKILHVLDMEASEGDNDAEDTREGWPDDLRTFTDIIAIYLMSLPAGERAAVQRDITRQIVSRGRSRL
jgi:transcriptional regulator with XRE-family HTH domain